MKGVVDSDDLPLNVSREQLQQYKMIKVMSNKLVKASIKMMIKLAVEKEEDDDDEDESDEYEDDDSEETNEDEEKKNDSENEEEKETKEDEEKEEEKKEEKKKDIKYSKFFENYGKNLKLGIIEDIQNRNKLAKLLRFYSTNNTEEFTSLDDYIKRMQPKQDQIYYIAGEDKETLAKSPLLQKIINKGGEILLLDDPIDEFCVQNLAEYEKKKLKNVAKGELKLWDEDDETEKKKEKKIKEDFKPLIEWWKKILGKKVENLEISKRLTDAPCIIVSTEHGYSASMERIQKAQAFATQDKATSQYLYGKKTMEINTSHPAIKELRELILNNETPGNEAEDTALLLFESAMLESGYNLPDPHEFAMRMDRVLKYNLNLKRDEKSSPYEVIIDETEEEKKEESTEKVQEEKKEEGEEEAKTEENKEEVQTETKEKEEANADL